MSAVDREKVKEDWAQRGFSCDFWVDLPGRVWTDFVHDTDELVMVVEGEEEFEMNGKKYRPEVGEEFLIPAGTTTPHAISEKPLQGGCTDISGNNVPRSRARPTSTNHE